MEGSCCICSKNEGILTNIFAPITDVWIDQTQYSTAADILNDYARYEIFVIRQSICTYICPKCINQGIAALEFRKNFERNSELLMRHSTKCEQYKQLKSICDMISDDDLKMNNQSSQDLKVKQCSSVYKRKVHNPRKKSLSTSGESLLSDSINSHNNDEACSKDSSKYICNYCQGVFSTKGNLKAHLRIHTGERPFQCPHCSKTFTQKNGMIVHIRTHTGEHPFKCAFCPRTFAQVAGLMAHNRRHSWDGQHTIKLDSKKRREPRKAKSNI